MIRFIGDCPSGEFQECIFPVFDHNVFVTEIFPVVLPFGIAVSLSNGYILFCRFSPDS